MSTREYLFPLGVVRPTPVPTQHVHVPINTHVAPIPQLRLILPRHVSLQIKSRFSQHCSGRCSCLLSHSLEIFRTSVLRPATLPMARRPDQNGGTGPDRILVRREEGATFTLSKLNTRPALFWREMVFGGRRLPLINRPLGVGASPKGHEHKDTLPPFTVHNEHVQ